MSGYTIRMSPPFYCFAYWLTNVLLYMPTVLISVCYLTTSLRLTHTTGAGEEGDLFDHHAVACALQRRRAAGANRLCPMPYERGPLWGRLCSDSLFLHLGRLGCGSLYQR